MTTTILIVDDSTLTRKVLRKILATTPEFSILAEASNGQDALHKINDLRPDIVILDVEMPILNGLEVLQRLNKQPFQPKVLLFSSHTQQHAQITIDCLLAGASDYICKNQTEFSMRSLEELLLRKLKLLAQKRSIPTQSIQPSYLHILPPKIICIATSTGGPDALKIFFQQLSPKFSIPIVIVQHMPPLFTGYLSATLSRQTAHTITEAQTEGTLTHNSIILARGGTHLSITKDGHNIKYHSTQTPPVNGLRPCADILFHSAAIFQNRCLAIVLTGMGQDGLAGAHAIHRAGGTIFVQDEASSIVWGMPGAIIKADLPASILSIPAIVHHLNSFCS